MKRKYSLPILLCVVLLLTSCEIIMQPAPTNTTEALTQEPQITNVPLATQEQQSAQVSEQTLSPVTSVTPQNEPTPNNTMDFYSCYAFMVSYNPLNGWAEFDYFYMLKGQEAIDFLVDHEGYSQADAEEMVNNFADGEYVCRNTNKGLRTIDLDTVPIKLMYHSNGTLVADSTSIDATSADVTALYNLDPKYLFEHFFFYIHCDDDGNVTLVEQIYWC